MTEAEYLFSQLGEEASEVAQQVSKINRFGPSDKYAGTDNIHKLRLELNDLFAVVEFLQGRNLIPLDVYDMELVKKKKAKIEKYLAYARSTTNTVTGPTL